MNAFLAIVHDTWRQSRQQVVFIIMLIVLALTSIGTVALVGAKKGDDGASHVTVGGSEEFGRGLEDVWVVVYASTLQDQGEPMKPIDPFQPMSDEELEAAVAQQKAQFEAARKAADAEAGVPVDRRGVQVVLSGAARALFLPSMLLFIAAAAGYFPAMLEAGGIDILLAKPIDRLRIFLGKYAGGLALYSAAIGLAYLIVFVGVGLRTGVFEPRLFLVLPLQIFAAAVLYAMLAALGIFTRSSTLCIIVGYVLYIVVDGIVALVIGINQLGGSGVEWLDTVSDVVRWTIPNFRYLQTNAVSSVLNIPVMEVQPFITAGVWMVALLAFGYWRFGRADY